MSDSPLLPSAPGFSPVLFFFFARPDGMLNLHTIHKHTQKRTQTQTSKYQMCSSTPSHQTSRGHGQLWLRKEENKQTSKKCHTQDTRAKNNIYCSVDHPPCFYRFQLTISVCSGSLKRCHVSHLWKGSKNAMLMGLLTDGVGHEAKDSLITDGGSGYIRWEDTSRKRVRKTEWEREALRMMT